MKEEIKILIPKKSEYVSVIRMTTASIANTLNLNIDDIDDLKIIVSEISLYFMKVIEENIHSFQLEYIIEDNKFTIIFSDLNDGELKECSDDLCIMIIESLSDELYLDRNEKKAFITKMIK